MKYKPYKPTDWEARVDKTIRLISPRWQCSRMLAREREHQFRYLSALSSTARRNSGPLTSGETLRGSREKMQVMWNAINAVENSGLCTALMLKIQTYVCGRLRWQSRCGDKVIANEYEDYMRTKLTRAIDLTGRFSLRQMAMMDVKGMLIKGDMGTNIVREGPEIFLQGIEADRIGDPYDWRISNNYVRGIIIDDNGVPVAAKVYYRDRSTGMYKYDDIFEFRDQFGMPKFLFMVNPVSYDDYRGVSVFKTAIDNATYIDRMREYELQALMWAASQSGIYHTKSGLLPEQLPFDPNPSIDDFGRQVQTFTVRPNTVTAVGMGEDVGMFQHDRPSPNVIGMVHDSIRDVCVGVGVSYEFGWDKSGLNGPAVRQVSSEDARAIEIWQFLLTEQKLDPVATIVLGNGIINGEIPYTDKWNKWQWFFPSKGTIDVGRESEANINELDAGINSGALIAAEDGQDIDEIREQRGKEIEANIEESMDIAKKVSAKLKEDVDWREVYAIMFPKRGKGGGGGQGMVDYSRHVKQDAPGVTGDGVDLEDGDNGSEPNGKRSGAIRLRMGDMHIWYDPSQDRDDKGKFADEGKGSDEPGYVHPGEEGGKRLTQEEVIAETRRALMHGDTKSPFFPDYGPTKDSRADISRASEKGDSVVELVQATSGDPPSYGVRTKHGSEFFSPSTKDMTFEEARGAMGGEGQRQARMIASHIDEQIGIEFNDSHDGIGDWSDGAENSVVSEVGGFDDFDQLRYSAALKGRILNQKAVLAFQVGDGNDSMYNTYINSTDLEDIRNQFTKAGIQHKTILPDGDKTHIFVYDPGNKLESNINQVAEHYGSIVAKQKGTGEFVGESDTREGAARNYEAIVKDYERKFPDRGHYRSAQGKGADDNRGKITSLADVKPPTGDDDIGRFSTELNQTPEYQAVKEKLDVLAKETKSGNLMHWSIERNSDASGVLTADREALQSKVVSGFLNPKAVAPKGERPKLNLLIGAPGSGKTTAGLPLIKGEYTYVSPDALREKLPEYQNWNTPATQDESRMMTEKLVSLAMSARHNMTVDITGSNQPLTNQFVNEAGKAGYDVNVTHVQIPLYEAAKRAADRYNEGGKLTGRFTSPDYISGHVDHLPEQTYENLKSNPYVSSWKRVDNSGKEPKVIDEGSKASPKIKISKATGSAIPYGINEGGTP